MTVSASYAPAQFVADGTTVAFPYAHPFFSASDLTVSLLTTATGVVTTPALNGSGAYDFEVTGTQDSATGEYLSGGTVTFNTAPASMTITIDRAVAAVQDSSFTNNAPLQAKTLEGALDRLTMLAQQLLNGIARALHIPANDSTGTTTLLPLAAARANQFLLFDSAGNATAGLPAGTGATVSTPMQPVVNASSTTVATGLLGFLAAWTGAAGRTVAAKLGDYVTADDFGADRTGTTDSWAAITAALATGERVRLRKGTYVISQPLDVSGGVLEGASAAATFLISTSADATKPVIYAGGNAIISDLTIGFNQSSLSGSETQGHRVGIWAVSQASGLALQVGAALQNLIIQNVGTAIYEPSNSPGVFSTRFNNLNFIGCTYRGIDMNGAIRTGNDWDLLTYSAPGSGGLWANADRAMSWTGEESEGKWGQLNVQGPGGGTYGVLNVAFYFDGCRAISGGSLHVEAIAARSATTPLIYFTRSAGQIEALTAFYMPIITAGWQLLGLGDTTYQVTGSLSPLTLNGLRIGSFHLKGLNSYSPSYAGMNGISNLYFVSRPSGAAGVFYLEIDRYPWDTFNQGGAGSDTWVYQQFPTTGPINFVATAAGPQVGKVTSATGWMQRQDGMIEMWGPVTVAANTSATVTLPTMTGASSAGFPTACRYQEASPNDTTTTGTANYRFNASPVSASQISITNTANYAVSGFWFARGF